MTSRSGSRSPASRAHLAATAAKPVKRREEDRSPSVRQKPTAAIKLKRAYEKPAREDGWRVLVERLWPRGLTKSEAKIDLWLKDVAPSTELRKWFGHDPAKWAQFRRRYQSELKQHRESIDMLEQKARERPVTLVYAARDQEHNGAVVLKEFIENDLSHKPT